MLDARTIVTLVLLLIGRCGGSAPKPPAPPPPPAAAPAAAPTGDLSKPVIKATIHAHAAEVEYCYQKRLLVRPELRGTVTVVFRIAADGSVEHASASGVDDELLTTCIAEVIHSLRFPPPKGGGFVNVSYPFKLRQTTDPP